MKILAGTACLLLSLVACNAGAISKADKAPVTKNITVADFAGIDAATGIKVSYTQGPLTPAKVTAPRYILDYLVVKVKNGTIDMKIDSSYWNKYHSVNGEITVTLSSPAVNDLEASSGASINIKGTLNVRGNADVETSSGASISIPSGLTATGSVDLETASGSSIKITGLKAAKVECDLSSGSDMNLSAVLCDIAEFDLSSGASCTVTGRTGTMKAEASSGASLQAKRFIAKTARIEAGSGGSVDFNAANASVDTGNTGSATNHH